MAQNIRIDQFLDSTGRVIQIPSKRNKKLAVLEYLIEKFEMGNSYSEKQVNEICERWITFGDYYLLRRELIENGFLDRERDGSKYWRIWEKPLNSEE